MGHESWVMGEKMEKIKSYRNLELWQKSVDLVTEISY